MAAISLTFTGGENMRRVLQQMLRDMPSTQLRAGFLQGATYPDGTPVAQVAFWNEFGTVRIPPRPFFRGMIAQDSGRWGSLLAGFLRGSYNSVRALRLMGEHIKDELQQSIVRFTTPENAPSTVKRKGFNKPLIDTGVMQRAVDYEVVK